MGWPYISCKLPYQSELTKLLLINLCEYMWWCSHQQYMCCWQDKPIDEWVKMPTCNLAETVHNKWLQKPGNKMTSLYEATVDDMIYAFMQMSNYISLLKGGSTCKAPDSKSLKAKISKSLQGIEIQTYWPRPWSLTQGKNRQYMGSCVGGFQALLFHD